MNNYLNLLGLATRARSTVSGETLIKGIQSKNVCFVVIALDASENAKKKITDKCQYYGIDYVLIGDTVSISRAIGKYNRVAVGITNAGFAKKIKDEIGG